MLPSIRTADPRASKSSIRGFPCPGTPLPYLDIVAHSAAPIFEFAIITEVLSLPETGIPVCHNERVRNPTFPDKKKAAMNPAVRFWCPAPIAFVHRYCCVAEVPVSPCCIRRTRSSIAINSETVTNL